MENPKNLQSQPEFCYNCMTRLEDGQTICPACGHDSSVRLNPRNALPEGTILEGKYLIGKVLGRGGFGITYLGYDLALTVRTAIKEYFPAGIGVRSSDLINVVPASSLSDKGSFQKGCNEFQNEAQSLARFNSPNIVHVREYFRANGTAYIVMDYVEGSSLAKELEQSGGRMSWERTVDLFKPLILELKKLHEEHLIHRDIKPDNIYLAKDPKSGQERLVLLDFGSARQFISENITKTYTTTVTPGYAPIEQYSEKGHQGSYTDVYALSATMYTAITGIKPANAADRSVGSDRIVPIHEMEILIPEGVAKAIMHGLEIRKEDRPQTMQELYDELTNGTNQNKKAEEKHTTPAVPSEKHKSDNVIAPSGGQKKTGLILLAGAAVLIALVGLFLLLSRNNTKPVLNHSEQTQTERFLCCRWNWCGHKRLSRTLR